MAGTTEALVALTRFGLGPRPGEAAAIAADPRGFVAAQCDRPQAARIDRPLEPSDVLIPGFVEARRARKMALATQTALASAKSAVGEMLGMAETPAGNDMQAGNDMAGNDMAGGGAMTADAKAAQRQKRRAMREEAPRAAVYAGDALKAELDARFDHAVATDDPLVERLVMFWSNHFAVSIEKGGLVRVLTGAYEREAIRPHVLGSFRAMLEAAVTHPAMQLYLDNDRSTAPESQMGRLRGIGLNENLAREILELHTLGVDGGYTQADVGSLALVLTGWTVDRTGGNGGRAFLSTRHEPGPVTVLGATYRDAGRDRLGLVLDDLAAHPATARHVAGKLVRHFVADAPPPGLVETVAAAFTQSDGDLAVTTRALVEADAAWQPPPAKARSPYEMCIAVERATGVSVAGQQAVFAVVRALGQKVWAPPSPAGFPDHDDTWLAGDALLERLDWSIAFARRAAGRLDVPALGGALYGDAYDPETAAVVRRAESREQALALLLMSPAFQRR